MEAGVGIWHAAGLPAPADEPLEFDPEITASIAMVRVVTHKIYTHRAAGARWQRGARPRRECEGAASAEAVCV